MTIWDKLNGDRSYIIAEMSGNHAGSIDRAIEIIHAAKEAGADCIKIQTYTADTITMDCTNDYFTIQNGTWEKENLYQLYQKAYTPWEWQPKLKEEADRVGIDLFSTPFDRTAVDFLEELGMDFYKIASFEIVDIPLIKYVAAKGKPIIMSTGMATLDEIDEAVEAIRSMGNEQFALLRCASAYPAITDEMNLATMMDMKRRYGVPVGLSDHSMGGLAAVIAVSLGGQIIEKHFCMDRRIPNPDSSFSMEPAEFAQMVRDIRLAKKARGEVKYGPTAQEQSNRAFRKSIFVTGNIQKGEAYTPENIRVIRPAYGLHPREYEHVLNKKATRDIEAGTPLRSEDVSDYLEIVPARREDRELLFRWTNDKAVRQNSFAEHEITWEEHVAWYNASMERIDRKIFLGVHGTDRIGMIRFDVEEHVAEISYSIAEEYRGRGYGRALIQYGLAQMVELQPEITEAVARVKQDNVISQRIFETAGFVRMDSEGADYVLYSYRCQ